jgi:hypothetical protein
VKRTTLLVGAFLVVVAAAHVSALSPPQYSLQRMILNSVGARPCVNVSDVITVDDTHARIEVKGCNQATATALAAVLLPEHTFGSLVVSVVAVDRKGNPVTDPLMGRTTTPEELRTLFVKALKQGRAYSRTTIGTTPLAAVWVEARKVVVQFWNDDLGDRWGNANYTAEDVFRTVLKNTFDGDGGPLSVGITTSRQPLGW